jgi:hypothetical protein
MSTKLNIVELLKDCPKGMELDCIICDNVKFIELDRNPNYPIVVRANNSYEFSLTKYGQVHNLDNAKCVIFPKGKTTWEGFVPPCKFKDGDIVAYDNGSSPSTVFIYRNYNPDWNTCYFVALSGRTGKFYKEPSGALMGYNPDVRFATEEEKQKLFKSIKEKYYRWNPETKTLEKLIEPKFKVGDIIKKVNGDKKGIITDIVTDIVNDSYYKLEIKEDYYYVSIANQNNWELSMDKFDFNTLKPFDQVLVRDDIGEKWHIQLFEKYNKNLPYPFQCMRSTYRQCIPYKGNELLLDTKDDCAYIYKVW